MFPCRRILANSSWPHPLNAAGSFLSHIFGRRVLKSSASKHQRFAERTGGKNRASPGQPGGQTLTRQDRKEKRPLQKFLVSLGNKKKKTREPDPGKGIAPLPGISWRFRSDLPRSCFLACVVSPESRSVANAFELTAAQTPLLPSCRRKMAVAPGAQGISEPRIFLSPRPPYQPEKSACTGMSLESPHPIRPSWTRPKCYQKAAKVDRTTPTPLRTTILDGALQRRSFLRRPSAPTAAIFPISAIISPRFT